MAPYSYHDNPHDSQEYHDHSHYDAPKAANRSTWSERRLIRTMEQTRLFDRLRGRLNPRQEKALLRLFRAEPDGFEGGLSADNYRRDHRRTRLHCYA